MPKHIRSFRTLAGVALALSLVLAESTMARDEKSSSAPVSNAGSAGGRGDLAIAHAQLPTLLNAGNAQEVIKRATQIIAADPKNATAYYFRALALQSNRMTQERAVQDLSKAISLSPDMAELYSVKATILHEQQEDEEALPVINKAMTLSPNNWDIVNTKAKILTTLRRPDEALVLEDSILQHAPKDHRYHFQRAQTLKLLGRMTDVERELDQSLVLNPTSVPYREDRMTTCFRLKKYNKIIEDADYILARGSRKREAFEKRAAAHTALKQYAEAIADFKSAIRETHSDSQMRTLHAQLKTAYDLAGDAKNSLIEADYIKKLDEDMRPL